MALTEFGEYGEWIDSGTETEWGGETLSVSDLVVIPRMDVLKLIRTFTLTVRDITIDVSAEQLTVIFSKLLEVADMAVVVASDVPTLELGSVIVSPHAVVVTIDNVVLQDVHYNLVVDNIAVEVSSEAPILSVTLNVSDIYVVVATEAVEVTVVYTLQPNDLTVACVPAGSLALVQQHVLEVDDAAVVIEVDEPVLEQHNVLSVANIACVTNFPAVLFPAYGGLADTKFRSVTTRRSFNLA